MELTQATRMHRSRSNAILIPMGVAADRERLCRLAPRWALTSLAEAENWVRERGVVEVTACCSLPSLHVAVHEPPYKPGSRGFGLYPATTWWWSSELATHKGLRALKIHRGKTVLATDDVARLADTPARASLAEADAGKLGDLEQRIVQHLITTGPGEVGDLRAELDVSARAFRGARERLERVGAILARPVELEPHGHSSLLSRWDQVFLAESPGGLAELVVAFVRAAVIAPEAELARWLSWPLPQGTVERLVEDGRLRRTGAALVTTADYAGSDLSV